MYRKGPAFDVFLIIICIYLIKTFFLKKGLINTGKVLDRTF